MKQTIWEQILHNISTRIDAHRFETWFRPLKAVENEPPHQLILLAPNSFVAEFLEGHYKKTIQKIAIELQTKISEVIISVDSTTDSPSPTPPATYMETAETLQQTSDLPLPQRTKSPTLNKRFSFETFVIGAGNEFAHSAARAVADAPGETKFNPLLIYGGVGLGKTHLLQAIGNEVLTLKPSYKVCYCTSEEFYLNFIEAIKNNRTKDFTVTYRTADLLLVDDVQFLAGKESTQEEFFYIFNTLYQNGKQIVLTSDLPPSALKGLQDRLVSRFQWGLSVDIQPPNLETRVAILKKKAEEDHLNLPENVVYYIAEHISSNIRELEGAIIRLLAFASITKSDITLDLVKSVLSISLKQEKTKISIDDIIERVSAYYNVPVNNIREKNRRKEVAHCRQVAMYICKSVTGYSLKTIGLNFGGRDHSTVIHAISTIDKLKKEDEQIDRDINYLISQL